MTAARTCAALFLCAIAAVCFSPHASGAGGISFHGSYAAQYASDSTTTLRLNAPAGAEAGDILIASLAFGSSSAGVQPTLTAPTGWTLVTKTNRDPVATLAVYRHVYAAGETSYAWTTSIPVGGTVFVSAFGGVDTSNPVDVAGGQTLTATGTPATPSLTTTASGDLLVASFYGYRGNALGGSWTPPTGMTEIGDTSNGASRSGSVDYAVQAAAGSTGSKAATASATQEYVIAALVALRPATSPPPPPPPSSGIALHGSTQATYPSDSTTSLRLTAPAGAQAGDLLVASLGFGASGASAQPTLTAPSGWTLVTRTNRDAVGALAVYRHAFAAGETSYTWTTSVPVGGTIFLAAFSGLDPASPVEAANGWMTVAASAIPTPSVTTTTAGDLLLASFYGHRIGATSGSWTAPDGMTEIADAHNGGSRSGSIDYAIQPTPGATGTKTATASATLEYGIGTLVALRPAPAPAVPPTATAIAFHGSSSSQYSSDSTTTLRLSAPAGAESGDVLIATLGFGSSSASSQPELTAPAGWTLVTKTNKDPVATLAVFRHVFVAGETSYSWTTGIPVGGTAFVTAFAGHDASNPVDAAAGQAVAATSSVATPSVTTTSAGDLLLASYYGYRDNGVAGSWSPPPGMAEIGDTSNGGSRSGSMDYAVQPSAGSTGGKAAIASATQTYAIAGLVALRAAPIGPVAVTLDTDLFGSADDAEALATAFALQQRNEAKVIAIGVSARSNRAVAPDSWKCAAAIAQYYNAGSTPIGVEPPANGTVVNTPDIVGPCARLAAPSTPAPDSAVNVYRRALSSQPDGSVVMVSTGFLGNLSALLNSPADAISPLGGRDLIARKVRRLVVMGGGYPSRPGESNLSGNPVPAQNVANNWPTKVVWSGYEVGDLVHTGQTISRVHPTWSPLRVAYEALVSPGNWYFAYDPVTVYHAIRPADPLLTDVGPGRNAVDGNGGNVFTAGAGNQYYVRLGDATALGTEVEKLLDTLPVRVDLPAVGHVFVVVLENGDPAAFAPASPAPYLAQTLTSQGAFLPNYHGVTHDSLGNYLGLISGQGPSADIQADCPVFKDFAATGSGADGQLLGNGCVYPASVQTIADQLVARGMTWKGYMEDMGNFPSREPATCGHPPLNAVDPADTAMIGDQYAMRHNPFVYFHSIIDSISLCDQNDVPLSRLSLDLASIATTPNFSVISPNLCNDGHDNPCIDGRQGGLVAIDAWLRQWVPVITDSSAFKKDGLLLVLFDESDGSGAGCCNQAQFPNVTNNGGPTPGLGGGRLGAVALSPFIRPGTVTQTGYNHFSALRTLESMWELPLLGYAASPNPGLFGRDVFSG